MDVGICAPYSNSLNSIFTYFYTSPKEKDAKIENNQIELNKQMQEMRLDYLNKYHEIKDFVLETCKGKK
jgi:hypothetical protein